MNTFVIEGTWEEVLDHARELAGKRVRVTVVEDAEAQRAQPKPIWQLAIEAMRDVPESELAKLPVDGSVNLDHYLYGSPKRTE